VTKALIISSKVKTQNCPTLVLVRMAGVAHRLAPRICETEPPAGLTNPYGSQRTWRSPR